MKENLIAELESLREKALRELDIVKVWESIPGFKEKHPLHAPPRRIALCPFHSEKTPSCRVYYNSQRFHCYGCGKNGDVLVLLEKMGEIESVDYILRLPGAAQEDCVRSLRKTLGWYAQISSSLTNNTPDLFQD